MMMADVGNAECDGRLSVCLSVCVSYDTNYGTYAILYLSSPSVRFIFVSGRVLVLSRLSPLGFVLLSGRLLVWSCSVSLVFSFIVSLSLYDALCSFALHLAC